MKKKRLLELITELEADLIVLKSDCYSNRSSIRALGNKISDMKEDIARINERLAIMDGDVKLPQLFDEDEDNNK
jgi:predicted metal-dependent TIM-barrel fold hydrolase